MLKIWLLYICQWLAKTRMFCCEHRKIHQINLPQIYAIFRVKY